MAGGRARQSGCGGCGGGNERLKFMASCRRRTDAGSQRWMTGRRATWKSHASTRGRPKRHCDVEATYIRGRISYLSPSWLGLGTVMLLVYAILVGMAIENTPWQAATTSLSLAL